MTLPVHVPFHDDETPLSFASRLAAANGYRSVKAMLGLMGLRTWTGIWKADPRHLEVLGHWSGESMDRRLRYRGPQAGSKKAKPFGRAMLIPSIRLVVDNVRCCPACITEDLSRSGREIARPYIRAWWLIPEIENCPLHKRPLVVLPPAERDNEDLVRRIHKNLPKLKEEASAEIVVGTEFDEFILSCINGEPASSFLGEVPTHIAIGFCTRLGSDLLAAEARSDIAAGEFGYVVARGGQDAIVEAMRNAYRANVDDERSRFWFDHFPALGRWITLKVDDPEYALVLKIVREAAAWCMPVGPTDAILGGVPRRLHSLKSARKEFNLSDARIRAIMEQAGILEDVRSGRSKATFDAAMGEKLIREVLTSVEAVETARSLGTTPYQLRSLCQSGVLNNVADKLNFRKKRVRVERTELNQLLETLQQRATPAEQAEGMFTLSDAARATSLNYSAVVQSILAKRLKTVVYVGETCNLNNIRLDIDELLALKATDAAPRSLPTAGNSQRFLLPPEFRTLALTDLSKMEEGTAHQWLMRMRWPETKGEPYCPKCGTLRCLKYQNRYRFWCTNSACKNGFSVTVGTALSGGNLGFRKILIGLWFSVNTQSTRAALKLSREAGVSYQTARMLLKKLGDAWRWEETALEGNGRGGEGVADDIRLASSGVAPTLSWERNTARTGEL